MAGIKEAHFFLTGLSHKTADVEIREKLSFSPEKSVVILKGICSITSVTECVVLSTCTRTEIYAVLDDDGENVQQAIERFIIETSGADDSISSFFYRYTGKEVIEHLFRVSCGLDSMVLGEPQIFGQVKEAYSAACDHNCTGPALNRLFHHAFQVGKLIRNATSIGRGTISVSVVAVELAKKTLGSLKGRSALLIGAGKIGEFCSKQLVKSGLKHLYISNRTARRASELAKKMSAETIPFEQVIARGAEVDILMTSVTSDRPIFSASDFFSPSGSRKKPLLLIDLGVPRNIRADTSCSTVTVYNIDDLEHVVLDNLGRRKNEVKKAEAIIREEVEEYRGWLVERDVIPVIRGLRKQCETIRLEELEKLRNRIEPETFEKLDLLTRRIVRKLLHNPTIAMREAASDKSRERLIESVRELFIR